jgi:thymidylate synthase
VKFAVLINEKRNDMSKADNLFIAMCRNILDEGFSSEGQQVRAKWPDGTPAHTIKAFGVVNRYDLSDEFPALTLRPTAIKIAVDELLWIWQKKSNKINELAGNIWDEWADEDGTIGKAYGYQLAQKYKFAQGEMDQVDNVIWQLKNTPYSRRIMTNIYNFSDLHEMNLEPCAYSMTFNVTGNKLNGILNQRSQDILAANNWNVVQYSVLVHMLAQVTGLEAGELVHVISDAHIYDRHIPIIKELIERQTYPAPKFSLNPNIKDFYEFTVNDMRIDDYQKNAQIMNIPIAI